MIDHRKVLMENADQKHSAFNKMLTPGLENVLGVRTPVLRQLAKDIAKDDWRSYLALNDDQYHECILLQGMVITYAKMDFDERLSYIREYVRKITNWATCDMFSYKAKNNERDAYWDFLLEYTWEPDEFRMRFAVVMMMGNFIDDEHIDDYLKILERVKHPGYYLRMGVAWAVATCIAKYPEKTLDFMKDNALDDWTFNKSIQKAIESYRVSDEMKDVLRSMKRRSV
jgi:Predicted DNA alkylation repair enzyme